MKSWRRKIEPENIPNSYVDFWNMLYTAEYTVVRLHEMGVLHVNVDVVNGESLAMVFHDEIFWEKLEPLLSCT